MYDTILISKEQAKKFAHDIFDVLIQDIKSTEARKRKAFRSFTSNRCRCCCMRKWVA